MQMTDEHRAEIEARLAKATPGPWIITSWTAERIGTHAIYSSGDQDKGIILEQPEETEFPSDDLKFACAARQDIPTLLRHIDAQAAKLKAAEALEKALADALGVFEADDYGPDVRRPCRQALAQFRAVKEKGQS